MHHTIIQISNMKHPFFLLTFLLFGNLIQTSSLNAQTPTTVKDIDGFEYKIVRVGGQTWMAQNLGVTRFRNGDPIMEANSPEEWQRADRERIPAWCYYDNDPANGPLYGKLYNWYAASDPRGLAPAKWRIPNEIEWMRMIDYLGGKIKAGIQLKDSNGWKDDGNGVNKTGFKALPGGNRSERGTFNGIGNYGYWWSAQEHASETAEGFDMGYKYKEINKFAFRKGNGFSIRCVR